METIREFATCVAVGVCVFVASLVTTQNPTSKDNFRPSPGLVLDVPSIATISVPERDPIKVGGLGSALSRDPNEPNCVFVLTDRGPNVDAKPIAQSAEAGANGKSPAADDKLFVTPSFTPLIAKFEIVNKKLEHRATIELRDANGTKLSGLEKGGIDSEGLVAMKDGSFWVSDEYGPYLLHFGADGKLIEKLAPGDGPRALPRVLARRRSNRGMEGLTISPDGKTLYGMMQSALENPSPADADSSRALRIIAFDIASGKTQQFVYLTEKADLSCSDLVALGEMKFLVIERDGKIPGAKDKPSKAKNVWLADLSQCKDISDAKNTEAGLLTGGKTIEQLAPDELDKNFGAAKKTLKVNLLEKGNDYPHEKPEGICVFGDFIAIVNDDDFGIAADGKGGFAPKILPLTGAPDSGTLRFYSLR